MKTHDVEILEVLHEIRGRTHAHVSVSVSDATAVGIALSCSMNEHESLLEFAYERSVRSDVAAALDKLALTEAEFGILFGANAPRTSRADAQLRAFEQLPEGYEIETMLEEALTTTLKESSPQAMWRVSPALRVAACVALCRRNDVEECMSLALGVIVSSDSRQIEDLRTSLEDNGIDVLMLYQAITALAATVA